MLVFPFGVEGDTCDADASWNFFNTTGYYESVPVSLFAHLLDAHFGVGALIEFATFPIDNQVGRTKISAKCLFAHIILSAEFFDFENTFWFHGFSFLNVNIRAFIVGFFD